MLVPRLALTEATSLSGYFPDLDGNSGVSGVGLRRKYIPTGGWIANGI